MKQQLVRNMSWSGIAGIGKFGIAGTTLAVLGHVVEPTDMAIFGLGWSISILGQSIAQEGSGQALISMPNVTRRHYAAANFMMIAFSLLLVALTVVISVPVARFYAVPHLREALILGALFVPMMCLPSVDLAILQRDMNFKMLTTVQLSSTALASATAIGCALLKMNVLALFLVQGGVGVYAFLICRLVGIPHSFGRFGWQDLKNVFSLGAHMALGGLTGAISQSVPQYVVAKLVPAAELGLFTYCLRITQMAGSQLSNIIISVIYPTFASAFRSNTNVVALYIKMSPYMTICVTFPLVAIALNPAAFIQFYGGAKWLPGAPILFWFLLMQITYSVGSGVFAAYKSLGMPSAAWIWNVLIIVLNFVSIVIGSHMGGAKGASIAMAVTSLVTPTPLTLLCRKFGQPVSAYWIKSGKILGSVALSVAGTHLFIMVVPMAGLYALFSFAVHTSFGLLIYLAILAALLPEERAEILTLARRACRGRTKLATGLSYARGRKHDN